MPSILNRASRKRLADIYGRLFKFYGPQGWWPGRSRLEVIVGAILTQNTAWTNVEKAIANLRGSGSLSSPVSITNMRRSSLSRLIRPAGYYNVKARRLKNFFDFLSGSYGGKIAGMKNIPTERLRPELLEVNGIGPETCDSILLYALDRPVFVVDAYTKRLLSRHGFCGGDAGYDEMQGLFMENLPRDTRLYNEYHALIVRLCKEHCRAKPVCDGCPLKGVRPLLYLQK